MSTLRSLTCFVLAALLIELAAAASYAVGGANGGWDTTTDVQTWASSQKFVVGDTLVFQYAPGHDVTEVTKADYDSCRATSPIKTSTGGSSTVSLTSPGKRYFICTTPGHCAGGMKLQVDTLAATSNPPAATPDTPQAASPSTPPPRSPAASPPSKSPAESPARSPHSSLAPKAAVSSPAATPGSVPPSETPAGSAPPSGSTAESPKSSANIGSLTFAWAIGVCFGVMSLLAV